MLIRCWGARGSIPVSGPQFNRYGGDTTCMELRTDDSVIIIDAGSGIRRLGNRLVKEHCREMTMLFTHTHWDHILGFPFFKPIYREDVRIILHGCTAKQGNIEKLLSQTMQPPHYPVSYNALAARIDYIPECACKRDISINGVSVRTIPLNHPNLGLGFRFELAGRVFVFLTDNELRHPHPGGAAYSDYVDFCQGADLLVHDAEYLPEEYETTAQWGHSPYTDALRLAVDAGVKRFGLFHHNQDHGDDVIDSMVDDCRRRAPELDSFALSQEWQIELAP